MVRHQDEAAEGDKIQEGLIHEHIRSLVAQLTCGVAATCQLARRDLVALGRPAVPALTGVLSNPDPRVRLEAARALGQIAATSAAPALVGALEDRESGVRAAAAESLIALGRAVLRPSIEALAQRPDSALLREGVRQVLESLAGGDKTLTPVLKALKASQPSAELPRVARAALAKLPADAT